ncbi:MAG: hypothetical protein LBQ11_01405 [Candidatus Nomurabacteria bacterium]|jgi:hypothetical protein|nr:hypothetical protein [Candidatus Nomurabacteria bacterium]
MRFLPSRNSARREFGQIANEYDLVYFGTVDPKIDTDYKMIKGLTASPDVRDENYTTGDVYDYSVVFLQRSKQVLVSGKKQLRQWTILQVQLKKVIAPHFLIDGRRRTEEYGALLASTQRWREVGWQHVSDDADFPRLFATYARPLDVAAISFILTKEVQTMLAVHFSQFDYEFQGDKLIVYATNADIDLQVLDHMLRVGLWLARHLDK